MEVPIESLAHYCATVSPLIASTIAPLAVLLDIPGLTEKWYIRNGEPQPDPRASLILSGLSLGFSVVANALLLVRFSVQGKTWRIAARISVACWFVKVVIGIINLVVFGALTRNEPEFSYAEGFWSAVVSVIASGIILGLLIFHWAVEFREQSPKGEDCGCSLPPKRIDERHFMAQNTLLIFLVGITALIFSRIENWSYIEGIYFTIATFLTVGFGDFHPTRPSTKALLFPFALLGITFLASSVSMMVTFFQKHHRERKSKERAKREAEPREPKNTLGQEIDFLRQIHEGEDWQGLATSLAGFFAFWLVGAAIFCAVESWSYGDGLYFCYVFLLTLGYGDFALISPGGRVIFIVYSLMAVPIMAAFAVQAIQNVIERISRGCLDRRHATKGDCDHHKTEAIDEMHSELVRQSSIRLATQQGDQGVSISTENVKALLNHAVELEKIARQLLVAHLKEGSQPQILLRADWNLQSRDLRALDPGMNVANFADTLDEAETLKAVRNFRNHVAGMLAFGSHLLGLKDKEKYVFERCVEGIKEGELIPTLKHNAQ